MHAACLVLAILLPAQPEVLKPGTHKRFLEFGQQKRSYLLHIPPGYDPNKPMPLVVAFHGYSMTADLMPWFTGLSKKADQAGFLVVYPNGTGLLPGWNAGGFPGKLAKNQVDDVGFTAKLLDDVATLVKVDSKRVYATGMSNGGMMCHRLAAELPERFAAVAPVSGTLALDELSPKRPVPLLHFHGTADTFVPVDGIGTKKASFIKVKGVDETITTWVDLNKSNPLPIVARIPPKTSQQPIVQKYYPASEAGAEVMLYLIEGGGHTWPGGPANGGFIGNCTCDLNATDIMWDFFQRHHLP